MLRASRSASALASHESRQRPQVRFQTPPLSQPESQPLIEIDTTQSEPTPRPSNNSPTIPDVVDISSDAGLAGEFTLIDLSDDTILMSSAGNSSMRRNRERSILMSPVTSSAPSTALSTLPVLVASPSPSPTPSQSTTPSSSRDSLASTVQSTPSAESEPEKEEEKEKDAQENTEALDTPDLFSPVSSFEMPTFSSEPALCASPRIPASIHDWALCSEVGLLFMRPVMRERTVSCVACGQDCEDGAGSGANPTDPVFRSTFWKMTTCRADHRPPELANRKAGLCKTCDKDYVLQVVRGEHKCRHAGCRRVLRVDLDHVEHSLWDHPGLFSAFAALVLKESSYECAICCDTVEDSEGKDLTPECDHDRNACGTCLGRLCESAIQGDRLNDLICPEPDCRKPFTRDTIRNVVSADTLRLYDKKLAFAIMARNPNFRWCRCGHGQIHTGGEAQPEWRCSKCNKRYCFSCPDRDDDGCQHLRRVDNERALQRLRDEHERCRGVSDQSIRHRELARIAVQRLAIQARENAGATQLVIASTAKRCPRIGCRVPIQRDEGCGHMTCRRCLTEFCWGCKVIWKAPVRPGSIWTNGTWGGPSPTILKPLHLRSCQLAQDRTISRRRMNLGQYASGWDVDEGYDKELDKDLWIQEDQM